MTVMFVICGKGGKSDSHSFLPQAWRIVSPALIFFLIMTILSIVNLVIVQGGMNSFCESFKLELPDVSCEIAMNRFMTMPMKASPGLLHTTLTSFNYAAFSSWLLSALVLLARIILVIDFQLVRVTIKNVEYEKVSSSFKSIEEEDAIDPKDKSDVATTIC